MTNRLLNTSKMIIDCDGSTGIYHIGEICGIVPKNMDCIIEGWHFKKGKLIKEGIRKLIPGNRIFHIRNNVIEN